MPQVLNMALSRSCLGLCFLMVGLQVVWSDSSKPNVVFILVDDVGYNDLGYNNRTQHSPGRILTPHLDRLADSGVKLDNYYVQGTLPHDVCTILGICDPFPPYRQLNAKFS